MASQKSGLSVEAHAPAVVQGIIERKAMMFDDLSKITRDFAHEPDFRKLVETFINTLSSHFGVLDVFTLIRGSNPSERPAFYHAIGNLTGTDSFADRDMQMRPLAVLARTGTPVAVEHLESCGVSRDTVLMFRNAGVA